MKNEKHFHIMLTKKKNNDAGLDGWLHIGLIAALSAGEFTMACMAIIIRLKSKLLSIFFISFR